MLGKTVLAVAGLASSVSATYLTFMPKCWKACAREAGLMCNWGDMLCICSTASRGVLANSNACACNGCGETDFQTRLGIDMREITIGCRMIGRPLAADVARTVMEGSECRAPAAAPPAPFQAPAPPPFVSVPEPPSAPPPVAQAAPRPAVPVQPPAPSPQPPTQSPPAPPTDDAPATVSIVQTVVISPIPASEASHYAQATAMAAQSSASPTGSPNTPGSSGNGASGSSTSGTKSGHSGSGAVGGGSANQASSGGTGSVSKGSKSGSAQPALSTGGAPRPQFERALTAMAILAALAFRYA